MPLQDVIDKSTELQKLVSQLQQLNRAEAELQQKLQRVRDESRDIKLRVKTLQSDVASGKIDDQA